MLAERLDPIPQDGQRHITFKPHLGSREIHLYPLNPRQATNAFFKFTGTIGAIHTFNAVNGFRHSS